jgi:nicotinate-nucleotide--dimethylbenzimidazole phosphoribosyltransferase
MSDESSLVTGRPSLLINPHSLVMLISSNLQRQLQHKIDSKTKPIGALGMLEKIALQVGQIQNSLSPQIIQPHIIVFAADHGIAATGTVNPYPQAVTAQMVLNFLNGGAAINVFCKQNNIELTVVNCGVNDNFENIIAAPNFIQAAINKSTKNYLLEPAMTQQEAQQAINNGQTIIEQISSGGCNTVGLGEMGIGNTSSAALLMSSILQLPIAACVGKGTGTNRTQLQLKTTTLEAVAHLHSIEKLSQDPLSLLSKVGGFEIATMVGAYIKAAQLNMLIVVDGFIATAALLIAQQMYAATIGHCIFAHTSEEQGHEKMLNYLQAIPILHLGLRLGEGTGAALALPLIISAVNFLNEMASFETAGVTNKSQP